MCTRPLTLDDGTQVRCRECWQCRAQQVDDIVGRCIAEKRTSAGATAITLTYGRINDPLSRDYHSADHPRAAFLTYSDPQKLFKLLRFHGYPFRYFIAGEYGSMKGRAHWHAIFFWKDKIPPLEYQRREIWMRTDDKAWWPHGTYWAEKPEYEHFRYNCKYVLKDVNAEGKRSHVGRSKNPPLGFQFFMQRARKLVTEYLAPQDLMYDFPEAVKKSGERVQFMLRGRMAEFFLQAYVTGWTVMHGDKPMPPSDLLDKYLDPYEPLVALEPYRPRVHSPLDRVEDMFTGDRVPVGILALKHLRITPSEKTQQFGVWTSRGYLDETGKPIEFYQAGPWNQWFYDPPDGRKLSWMLTPEGKMGWLDVNLERRMAQNKKEWVGAAIAARQSGHSSHIQIGSRPGKTRHGNRL